MIPIRIRFGLDLCGQYKSHHTQSVVKKAITEIKSKYCGIRFIDTYILGT